MFFLTELVTSKTVLVTPFLVVSAFGN